MPNRIEVKTQAVPGIAPGPLLAGQIGINIGDTPPTLWVGDGSDTPRVVGSVGVGTEFPLSPLEGTFFWSLTEEALMIYIGGQWVPVGSAGDPASLIQQDLGNISGLNTIEVVNGRTVLARVEGATELQVSDGTGLVVGWLRLKLVLPNPTDMTWTFVNSWIGEWPQRLSAGTHNMIFYKVNNEWLGFYEGEEIAIDGGRRPFRMTIQIDNAGDTFEIFSQSGAFQFSVDWGDGIQSVISGPTDPNRIHTYAQPGIYQLIFTGGPVGNIHFGGYAAPSDNADRVLSIDAWGDFFGVALLRTFMYCRNLEFVAPGNPNGSGDVSSVQNFSNTFSYCENLKVFPQIDTSSATLLDGTFSNCLQLTHVYPLDTQNVTMLRGLFSNCASLLEAPYFNTSKCTNFSTMFSGCKKIPSLPLYDMSSAQQINNFAANCESLTSIPFFNCSNVTTASQAFNNCKGLTSFPVLAFPLCKDFSYTWSGCVSLTNFPKLNFPVGENFTAAWSGTSITVFPDIELPNATNMTATFDNCKFLTDVQIPALPKVTTISYMFRNCTSLKTFAFRDFPEVITASAFMQTCASLESLPLLTFPKLETANHLFSGCRKLTAIPALQFSDLVTNLSNAFSGCSALSTVDPGLRLSQAVGVEYSGIFASSANLVNFPPNMFDNIKSGRFQNAFQSTVMGQEGVDAILASFVASGVDSNTEPGFSPVLGSSTRFKVTASATGLADIATLESRGWTLN